MSHEEAALKQFYKYDVFKKKKTVYCSVELLAAKANRNVGCRLSRVGWKFAQNHLELKVNGL